MKRTILIIANYIFLCACYGQQKDILDSSFAKKSSEHNNVSKDIQLSSSGKTLLSYDQVHRATKIYKLDNLEYGYDSLEIRIWFDYSFAKSRHLVVIKRAARKWVCQLYTIKDSAGYNFYGAKMLPHTVEDITPRSGWPFFLNKLFSLNITSLPGSGMGTDGVSYWVEVATKTKYRFYVYWSPETTANKSLESKKMVDIIELLENECNFERLQK